jgi:predicted dithiol-disulfide oxidoreductase (DUF899 family)
MSNNEIVSRDDWLEARKDLLASEKEFTRLRDELTRKRQQLLIYHFMFGPGWDAATSMKISYRESRVPASADRSAE